MTCKQKGLWRIIAFHLSLSAIDAETPAPADPLQAVSPAVWPDPGGRSMLAIDCGPDRLFVKRVCTSTQGPWLLLVNSNQSGMFSLVSYVWSINHLCWCLCKLAFLNTHGHETSKGGNSCLKWWSCIGLLCRSVMDQESAHPWSSPKRVTGRQRKTPPTSVRDTSGFFGWQQFETLHPRKKYGRVTPII